MRESVPAVRKGPYPVVPAPLFGRMFPLGVAVCNYLTVAAGCRFGPRLAKAGRATGLDLVGDSLTGRGKKMSDRSTLLKLALMVFGAVFCLVYPLAIVWPSGWAWHAGAPYASEYFMMIVGVYATL